MVERIKTEWENISTIKKIKAILEVTKNNVLFLMNTQRRGIKRSTEKMIK